jgi:hypothetical protein
MECSRVTYKSENGPEPKTARSLRVAVPLQKALAVPIDGMKKERHID